MKLSKSGLCEAFMSSAIVLFVLVGVLFYDGLFATGLATLVPAVFATLAAWHTR